LEPESLIGIGLDHANHVIQLHLAERAPPFSMLVPESQASEFFALHQHHLTIRGHHAVLGFSGRCRRPIRHTSNIGWLAAVGLPDFAKDSTTLGIAGAFPLHILDVARNHLVPSLPMPPARSKIFPVHGGI
jgi:hypothetical protein